MMVIWKRVNHKFECEFCGECSYDNPTYSTYRRAWPEPFPEREAYADYWAYQDEFLFLMGDRRHYGYVVHLENQPITVIP